MFNFIVILIVGIAAGFLNTLAGGGSLLTMPILIFMGLPSAVANGTNRIALMVQNVVAVTNFRKKGYFDYKLGIMLGVPALLGSILGARLAINLPDQIFNRMLAIIMIVVLILIIWSPQKKFKFDKGGELSNKRKIMAMIVFFFVGIYGGLIQGGVGFIIIISLSLITGFSLVKINSLKVFVVVIYMASSLLVFILSGKVNIGMGLMLAIGNGIGGYLGSNFAVNKGDKWIKAILIVAVVAMAGKLLFLN